MNWLDFLVVAVVVLNTYYGWQRGLISQAFDLAGWLVGVIAALKYDDIIIAYAHEVTKFDLLTNIPRPIMLIGIFLVVRISFLLVGRVLHSVLHIPGLGICDTAGGAAFGLVKGSIQVMALFILMGIIRPQFYETALDTSVYSYKIDEYSAVLLECVDANKEKINDFKGMIIPDEGKKE